MEVSDKKFLFIFILIVLIAAFLRLYALDLRPVHFDEGGGHAKGAQELFHSGTYAYNPDFHGPFLYHITALSFYVFGENDIGLRIMEAFFGIGIVLLLYPLKAYFKKITILIIASLIAVSPAFVYYSKFALHDIFFVFFTLAVVVSMFLYDKFKKNVYAYFFAISLAFLFTVKENAYVFLAILVFCILFEMFYSSMKGRKKVKSLIKNVSSIFSWVKKNSKTVIVCIILFIFIFSMVYTSFFRFPNNLQIAITKPIVHWLKRGTEMGGFYRPYTFYVDILLKYEFAIFLFGIFGIFFILELNNRFTRFLVCWTILTLLIYMYMPYKLPNIVINLLLPLALCAGIFFDYILTKSKVYTIVISVLLILVLCVSLYISLDTNFVNYTLESNPLVFVQTVDDVKPLLKLVEKVSYEKTGGKTIDITVSIPQTEYPLSWYWRDYPNVKYVSEKVELPDSWTGVRWSGNGTILWATDQVKDGKRSGKVTSKDGMDGEWRQKVSLIGGSKYKLGVWVKTENIEVVNAGRYSQCYIRTDLNDNPDRIIGETKPLTGMNDWAYVETEFYVEKNESVIWLTCNIGNWGMTKGSIWYDNISINKEGESLNYVKNPSFENGEKIDKLLGPSIVIISESDGQTLQPVDGYLLNKFTLRPGVVLATYVKK